MRCEYVRFFEILMGQVQGGCSPHMMSRTRGHCLRIRDCQIKSEMRKIYIFFSNDSESLEFLASECCRCQILEYIQT